MTGPDHKEIVRRLVDAWNRLDEEGFVAVCTPEVEFVSILSRVEGNVYRGHDGVRRYFADIRSLGRNHIALDALIQVDETTVLALEHVTGEGRVSGASLDIHTGNVFRFDGELVSSLHAFIPPERALAEVGFADWDGSPAS